MIPHRQIAWNAYNTVVSWQLRQSDRRASTARNGRPSGSAPDENRLQYREQARRVYYGAVFEIKKEIPSRTLPVSWSRRKSRVSRSQELQPIPAATSKMDRSLAHSIAFRAATNWASQILSWASFLIVVRLLAPSDFGIAAMALVFWPYLRLLGEVGIPTTVLTFRDMTDDQLS
jgi:hypothetical protein